METFRLKNIAILILLLLNAWLLVLLGYQYLQTRQADSGVEESLRALYESGGLALDPSADLLEEAMPPLTLSRRVETEAQMASALLLEEAEAVSQGGGIYSYSAGTGTIQFRSGGSFDGTDLRCPADNPAEFAQSFCGRFGYAELVLQEDEGEVAVTAVQHLLGVPVYGCGLTLRFEDGFLTAVSGSHVSSEDAVTEPGEQLSCATALLRFLDFRAAAGVVCSEVRTVRCVYELQSSSAALRLRPLWQIDTDTYRYFVDCASGAVTRL